MGSISWEKQWDTSNQVIEDVRHCEHDLSCELYLHPFLQAPHRGPSLPSAHPWAHEGDVKFASKLHVSLNT